MPSGGRDTDARGVRDTDARGMLQDVHDTRDMLRGVLTRE